MKKSALIASLGIAGLVAVGCASSKKEEKPAEQPAATEAAPAAAPADGAAKPAEGSCGGEKKADEAPKG
jgi:hypothetical protein